MEYSIKKLSQIAGVSTRTLRYYDEINLLKPARINSSGYRIYGAKEVDRLQQILFYKELGLNLDHIKEIINNPKFDKISALKEHKLKLLEKKKQIDMLLENVSKTLLAVEGEIIMDDKEKFAGFKRDAIEKNEKKYGKEIRQKYSDEVIDKSNEKFNNMTEEQYNEVEALAAQIIETLKNAMKTNDPSSDLAQEAAELHKKWLCYYWEKYSKEAHAGVAQMYVYDERFKEYYDKHQDGMAEFLRDAILIYTSNSK